MAEARPGDGGGIRGLLELLDEHREALDYDCLTLGLDLNDLGTVRLDWRRFKAIVLYLPSTSALAQSIHGEKATWTTTEHLLAAAVDALHIANWQRSGKKSAPKPKPVPRPGDDESSTSSRRFGTASMPIDEARDFFNRVNRRTQPVETARTCAECDRTDLHARGLCSKHYQRWWRHRDPDHQPNTS